MRISYWSSDVCSSDLPEILQAMVYGDKRPHLVGILVPDPEWMAEWAEAEGLPQDFARLREHEKFRAAIRAAVDRVNGQLSVIEKANGRTAWRERVCEYV